MKNFKIITALVISFQCFFLVGQGNAGQVLCFVENGHIEIERIHKTSCNSNELLTTFLSPETKSKVCRDINLPTANNYKKSKIHFEILDNNILFSNFSQVNLTELNSSTKPQLISNLAFKFISTIVLLI